MGRAARIAGEAAEKSAAQALEKPVENGWISMSGVVGGVIGVVFRMSC